MNEPNLNSILVAAEQLANDIEGDKDEYRTVNRTLKQVLDCSNKLWSKVSSSGPQDTEANLLLSSKGVDLPHLSKKLENIATHSFTTPSDPFPVTDIANFLNNEKENTILSIIELTHQKFDKLLEDKIDAELQKNALNRRNNLLNSLHKLADLHDDTPFVQRETVQDDPLFRVGSSLDQYQILYAEKLSEYNTMVLNGKSPNLIEIFTSAISERSSELSHMKVKDIWKVVSVMSHIPLFNAQDVLQSRLSSTVIEKLISQARYYLEERYKSYMETVISYNILNACRGAIPGVFSLVQSFVKVRVSTEYKDMEHIFVDNLPFWPMFYYCFRCGDLDAAIYCIKRSESDLHELLRAINELKNSANKRLPPEMAKLYRSLLRNSGDPYKKVLYGILGLCDITGKHPSVIISTDDYLWLQLCQVKDNSMEQQTADTESLGYSLLQTLISEEYGENYFNAAEQPQIYFQMLFLTGQFEAAIDVLFRSPTYYTHAIHIAIALQEQHLLALSDLIQRPLLSAVDNKDKKPMKRLNLCTMIKMYVKAFQENDPIVALHYYFSLRNVYADKDQCMFPHFVSELILETEQYDTILGYLEQDGCRIKGALDQFSHCELEINDVIRNVAYALKDKGKYYDAVKLFDLCNDFENLLMVANSILSEYLTNLTEDESRMYIIDYVERVLIRKQGVRSTAHPDTINTFNILHGLLKFFQLYASHRYLNALDAIQKLDIIPLRSEDVETKVEYFRNMNSLVTRTIGDVLFAVINVLSIQYKEMKSNLGSCGLDKSVQNNLLQIQEQANAIVSFIGRIPFQLPGDTNSRIVQLKILMN